MKSMLQYDVETVLSITNTGEETGILVEWV